MRLMVSLTPAYLKSSSHVAEEPASYTPETEAVGDSPSSSVFIAQIGSHSQAALSPKKRAVRPPCSFLPASTSSWAASPFVIIEPAALLVLRRTEAQGAAILGSQMPRKQRHLSPASALPREPQLHVLRGHSTALPRTHTPPSPPWVLGCPRGRGRYMYSRRQNCKGGAVWP